MPKRFNHPDDFSELVKINRYQLDHELAVQAAFMYVISERKSDASLAAADRKDELARVESSLRARLRTNHREGPKQTESDIAASIQVHRDRTAAWDAYQAARRLLERWEGLYETWKQRGFALKTLADLYQSNYYTIDAAGKDKRPEEQDWQDARIALNKDRMSRSSTTVRGTSRTPLNET